MTIIEIHLAVQMDSSKRRYQTKLYVTRNAMMRKRTCFSIGNVAWVKLRVITLWYTRKIWQQLESLSDASNNSYALFCALQAVSVYHNYR